LFFRFFPLQVWAETIQASPPRLSITRPQGLPEAHAASPAQTQSETIALSANPWLAELNQTEPVAPLGLGGIQIQPWMWLLSVPVSGLGQLVMGDPIRGLLFFLVSPLFLWLIFYPLPGLFSQLNGGFRPAIQSGNFSTQAFAPTFGIEILLGALAVIGVWIWNIVDAIQMNERLLSASSKQAEEINPEEMNPEEMKQELQAKLDAFMTLAENNQLQMGATGPYLNHRLLYF
jgi:hypothetical protein